MPTPVSITLNTSLTALADGGFGLDHHVDRTGLGELDGVADQIEQHLTDPRRIAGDVVRHVRPDPRRQRQPLLLGARRQQIDRRIDRTMQPEFDLLDLQPVGVELGEIQHVVQQLQQIVGGLRARWTRSCSARAADRRRPAGRRARSRRSSACGFRGSSSPEIPSARGCPSRRRRAIWPGRSGSGRSAPTTTMISSVSSTATIRSLSRSLR